MTFVFTFFIIIRRRAIIECALVSFNAAASVDYIYLQAGRVRPGGGGGVKANLIFLSWGTVGGSKQIRTNK